MPLQRLSNAGPRHVHPLVQSIKKRLKLGLVGMIGHVAGIGHRHGQVRPFLVPETELVGVDLIVEQAALAAYEVSLKVVGLKAIDHRSDLSNAAVGKLENRSRRGGVFIFLEAFVLRSRRVRADLFNLVPHAEQ